MVLEILLIGAGIGLASATGGGVAIAMKWDEIVDKVSERIAKKRRLKRQRERQRVLAEDREIAAEELRDTMERQRQLNVCTNTDGAPWVCHLVVDAYCLAVS